MENYEREMARVHGLAVAAMQSVTSPPASPSAGPLRPDELRRLGNAPPSLLAAMSRALAHLGPGGAPPAGRDRVRGGSPARPGRRAAVANGKMA